MYSLVRPSASVDEDHNGDDGGSELQDPGHESVDVDVPWKEAPSVQKQAVVHQRVGEPQVEHHWYNFLKIFYN